MFIGLSVRSRLVYFGKGYIAGQGQGIVTVASKPASRLVYLYVLSSHIPPTLIDRVWSNNAGNYIFTRLSLKHKYLVMVRDYKGGYEPFCWDYVKPADDLTIAEQQAIWQSFQS